MQGGGFRERSENTQSPSSGSPSAVLSRPPSVTPSRALPRLPLAPRTHSWRPCGLPAPLCHAAPTVTFAAPRIPASAPRPQSHGHRHGHRASHGAAQAPLAWLLALRARRFLLPALLLQVPFLSTFHLPFLLATFSSIFLQFWEIFFLDSFFVIRILSQHCNGGTFRQLRLRLIFFGCGARV